jgi:hypothetical protein
MTAPVRQGELPKKRRWLLEQMPRGGCCAEIGVWQGDFAHWILEITAPKELHLVDPWAFSPRDRDHDTWHGRALAGGQDTMDEVHDRVVGRFADETASGLVTIHRVPSHEAAATFPAAYFDWIYIDGDHFYDAVSRDLLVWERTVKPGGIIAGDDYRESPIYGTDVVRAVDEFAAARRLRVESWGRQFLMRLPGEASALSAD